MCFLFTTQYKQNLTQLNRQQYKSPALQSLIEPILVVESWNPDLTKCPPNDDTYTNLTAQYSKYSLEEACNAADDLWQIETHATMANTSSVCRTLLPFWENLSRPSSSGGTVLSQTLKYQDAVMGYHNSGGWTGIDHEKLQSMAGSCWESWRSWLKDDVNKYVHSGS